MRHTAKLVYDPEIIMSKCLLAYDREEDFHVSEGKLDPIPEGLAGRVDLSDRSLHPEYPPDSPMGRVQRLLFSDCPKEFMIKNPLPVEFRSSNKEHLRHVHDLLEAAIAVKKNSKERERGFAKFFTVLKKYDDDGIAILRTIMDCVTANKNFIAPDPVNLANLHCVLTAFAEVESMRCLDLRHWFHQLKVGDYLSSCFVIAFGSLRLKYMVLPMGWTWAPFCAQAVTTFAVAGDEALKWTEIPKMIQCGNVRAFVIYDNVLAGGPEKELDIWWEGLLSRLAKLNAVVKEGSEMKAAHGSSLDCIGLTWVPSVSGLRWCPLPRFSEKVELMDSVFKQPTCRTKQIASCLGLLQWSRYAAKMDICDMHKFYQLLAEDVRRAGWCGTCDPSQYIGAFEKLREMSSMGFQTFTPRQDEVLAFTDAHIGGYGHVGGFPVVARSSYWPIGSSYESKDMFYLEAIAAKQTVFTFARKGRCIFLGCDNQALVFALQNKTTACPRTAVVLHELFEHLRNLDCMLIVGWIPTEHNPSDELSRHERMSREKLLAAEQYVKWTVPPVPQFGCTLGRVVG